MESPSASVLSTSKLYLPWQRLSDELEEIVLRNKLLFKGNRCFLVQLENVSQSFKGFLEVPKA